MLFTRIIMLIALAIAPTATFAQVVMQPAAPLTPNEKHLAILRQGVEVWNKWREDNPNVIPDLNGANLKGAKLIEVNLSRASLCTANLSDAALSRANLAGADLSSAVLSGALLGVADLTGADLSSANLTGADLFRSDLSLTNLFGAKLTEAKLSGAKLSGANLYLANLSGANLVGADLKDANLRSTELKGAIFELNTVPRARNVMGSTGLRELSVRLLETNDGSPFHDIGALVELREDANKVGLRTMERDLTYAIERIRNGDTSRPWYARAFYYLAFDFTSSYGADPQKPFWILLWVFLVGGFAHMVLLITARGGSLFADFRLKYKDEYVSIKLDWTPHGFHPKMTPEPKRPNRYPKAIPNRYLMKFKCPPMSKAKLFLRLVGRVIRIGFYFSLLSTFNIGYREFNVGNWIGRLQKRQYTLRARGWLRVVSGAQSLLGVYLLALWLVCTFGRPFG